MGGTSSPEATRVARCAEPPWQAQSAPWRPIHAPLSQDPLARAIRQALTHRDLTALSAS
jgi:hypothetical protein